MRIEITNPADGTALARYTMHSQRELEDMLEGASRAFSTWRDAGFETRAGCMRAAGGVLAERRDEFAALMADEMGKPVAQGRAEAEKCAWVCEYYAQHAESMLAPRPVETDASRSYVAFEPLGAILAIMPWNFPFWQVFRFAAPTLMAGNTCLLKHARNVTGCAMAIEDVFRQAGFPDGALRAVLTDTDTVNDLIGDGRIAAVTLTGSPGAGRAVAAAAGRSLKKSVLELGGSDPYVVLADADLDAAVGTCVASRLINTGQSCIAAKRFIVVEEVAAEFTTAFVELMRTKKCGDPREEGIDLGPLARNDLRDDLHRQVRQSIEAGAECLTGGKLPERPGAWYPPTVLAGVTRGMPAYSEELFGPVASILTAKDEDDAVRLANDTMFGLGAAVFTRDSERGEALARKRLRAGSAFVNDFVRSDPRLPFGGIKASGYGRELGSAGIREFVNVKSVYVA
jgi:succinate-semialdehyde dehydrogenase / glutarate-semialdehyde dehydrogenase